MKFQSNRFTACCSETIITCVRPVTGLVPSVRSRGRTTSVRNKRSGRAVPPWWHRVENPQRSRTVASADPRAGGHARGPRAGSVRGDQTKRPVVAADPATPVLLRVTPVPAARPSPPGGIGRPLPTTGREPEASSGSLAARGYVTNCVRVFPLTGLPTDTRHRGRKSPGRSRLIQCC